MFFENICQMYQATQAVAEPGQMIKGKGVKPRGGHAPLRG